MPGPAIIKGPSPGPALLPFDITKVSAALSGTKQGASLQQTTISYVRKSGSDSNGGTSPSDAWLTINKALTTASPGTIIYVGAGTYREVVTVTITPTPGLPVSLIGDVDGLFTGDVGPVIFTAYLTNDKTIPSGTALLNLNGKSYLTFQKILFVVGSVQPILATVLTSQNITFLDCAFINKVQAAFSTIATLTLAQDVPANWLFDRCDFDRAAFSITVPRPSNNDLDINFVVRNCRVVHTWIAPAFTVSAGGLFNWGGFRILNCIIVGAGGNIFTTTANMSTKAPCLIYNCVLMGAGGTAFNANTQGHI